MTQPGGAFLKGGCGCLVAFLAIGLLFVMCGGSMHIDLGGAVMLFVIGGILGLIGYAIFDRRFSSTEDGIMELIPVGRTKSP